MEYVPGFTPPPPLAIYAPCEIPLHTLVLNFYTATNKELSLYMACPTGSNHDTYQFNTYHMHIPCCTGQPRDTIIGQFTSAQERVHDPFAGLGIGGLDLQGLFKQLHFLLPPREHLIRLGRTAGGERGQNCNNKNYVLNLHHI